MPKYTLSEEDKILFRQAIEQIRPIQKQGTPEKAFTTSRDLSDNIQTDVSSEDLLFYAKTRLSKSLLLKFKKGALPIQARLDLHGLTSQEAKTSLVSFVQFSLQKEYRLVLIIHGKGQPHELPRLKNLVNYWLPQFPETLAYTSAQPKDGGAGAVYLLLKRPR